MRNSLSSITIDSYLPEIRRIFTFLEMEVFQHSEILERKDQLNLFYLEKEVGSLRLLHAINILGQWLKGSHFEVELLGVKRSDASARWSELVDIIEAKLLDFANDAPIIELVISGDGRVSRKLIDIVLNHDFEGDGKKVELLKLLTIHCGYIDPEDICQRIGYAGRGSLNVTKKSVNDMLRASLQLPKEKDVIHSKRGSGYRINPLYNIVIVR